MQLGIGRLGRVFLVVSCVTAFPIAVFAQRRAAHTVGTSRPARYLNKPDTGPAAAPRATR